MHSLIPSFPILLPLLLLLSSLPPLAAPTSLTITISPTLPTLPPSTRAILTTTGFTHKTPVTRWNTFVFRNLSSPASYIFDIACRDYDFGRMRVEVEEGGKVVVLRGWSGSGAGGGDKVVEGVDVGFEARVLRRREYYDERVGFSPLSLLKNPMILIGVVGLAFVIGMPYLLDNMDPEMKAEFEEHQKKSILPGGGAANPLQNFDMAAWMAGKTSGSSSTARSQQGEDDGGAATTARSRKRG